MLFATLLSLLGSVTTSYASVTLNTHGVLDLQSRAEQFESHVSRDNVNAQYAKLEARQSSPPITTTPDCTLNTYDGYFYVTPQNYTWQLQCTNSYNGVLVAATTDTTSLDGCIQECIDYNRASAPGTCMGVTFLSSYSGADTVCNQYSDVNPVYQASEDGGLVYSALLILGPDGEIFATPSPEPTTSPTPTPTLETNPTTTSIGSATTSAILPLTTVASVTTTYTASTLTVTSTSTNTITSCLLGQSCQASTTPTYPRTSSITHSTTASGNLQTTSAPSFTISNGGSRPVSVQSTTSGAFIVDAGQTTFTKTVPFTEHRVQTIEICAATPSPCSQSVSTATDVMYKTEISCSPSACQGIVATAANLVDAILAATCVVSA